MTRRVWCSPLKLAGVLMLMCPMLAAAALAQELQKVSRAPQASPSASSSSYVEDLVNRARKLLAGTGAARNPSKAAALLESAARAGSAAAMQLLAQLYARGDGVPTNFDRARELLEKSVAAGSQRDGWRTLGDLFRQADATHRNPATAVDYYQRAVTLGDPQAMIALARMIGAGDGVPVDFDHARQLLEQAISAGAVADASSELGDLYRKAAPPHRDPQKAKDAYEQGIKIGDPWSMMSLADMLGSGDGVPYDFDGARSLLERAATAGAGKDALRALGDLYRNADPKHQDLEKAQKAYQAAIDLGNTSSMIALADMLTTDNAAANFDRARSLLEAAVAAGNVKVGSRALGELYATADLKQRNPAKAAIAYRAAADLGDDPARVALARLLAKGDGVPVDFDRARQLLDAAIKNGYVKGGNHALGDLYRDAGPPHRDPAMAVAAYEKAADAGDAGAMIALARMVAAGDGAPADFDRAKTLLEKAMSAGLVADAARALGDLYRQAGAPWRDPAKAVTAYQRAVDLHDPWAMINLAGTYSSGDDGVEANFEKARALLAAAIAAGSIKDAAGRLGTLYRNAKAPDRNPAKAQQAYQMAADAGDTDSMIALADMLGRGDGVPVDMGRAVKLLKRAIDAGDIQDGARTLGDLYQKSGNPEDRAKAIAAYDMAAEAGDTNAAISLATLLAADGAPADFERASGVLKKAIAAGARQDGLRTLGDIYLSADSQHRDPAQAEAAYTSAAELGDPWSMISLASMLSRGDGVPMDFERAREWLDEATKTSAKRVAFRILGDLYRDAAPSQRDPIKAIEAYRKAIDLGDTSAMISLAGELAQGDGVPADFDGARDLLQKAVAAGAIANGSRALGNLYINADSAHRDPFKAKQAYERAVELGDTVSMIALADIYETGDVIPIDYDYARALLERTVASGNVKDGARLLGDLFLKMPEPKRDAEKARANYEIAAKAGNSRAELSLAVLLVDEIRDPQTYPSAAAHFRAAAAALGRETVADEMMRMKSRSLVLIVQEYMREAGLGGPVDGAHNASTETAIGTYCSKFNVPDCDGSFISFDLLLHLLSTS